MIRNLTITTIVALGTVAAHAEVQPQAHYNLQGQGGIRDTAAPETLKNRTENSKHPALVRQGSPKITTESAPEPRRQTYDSVIKFEVDDQCYSVPQNLVGGDQLLSPPSGPTQWLAQGPPAKSKLLATE